MEKDAQGRITENPIVTAAKYVLENTAQGERLGAGDTARVRCRRACVAGGCVCRQAGCARCSPVSGAAADALEWQGHHTARDSQLEHMPVHTRAALTFLITPHMLRPLVWSVVRAFPTR